RRMSATGGAVDADPALLADLPSFGGLSCAAAYDGASYLLAYTHQNSTIGELDAVLFPPGGSAPQLPPAAEPVYPDPGGGVIGFSSPFPGPRAPAATRAAQPAATEPPGFIGPIVVDRGANAEFSPTVSFNGENYLVTWLDSRETAGDGQLDLMGVF